MFSGSCLSNVLDADRKTCTIGNEWNLLVIMASAALKPAPTIKIGSQSENHKETVH